MPLRDPGVAKFGIALEWGSRGRWFESSHSDQMYVSIKKVFVGGQSIESLGFQGLYVFQFDLPHECIFDNNIMNKRVAF